MVNIDAPEVAHKEKAAPAQPYSAQAKQYLMSMVMNQNVLIKEHGTDNYGRFLGEVYLNKLNVNKAMVASGYAWAYRYKLADQEYLQLENNARTKKSDYGKALIRLILMNGVKSIKTSFLKMAYPALELMRSTLEPLG